MHHIHHTEAFVLSDIENKEADRMLWLLTKDLGLILASAGGIRKQSSKLRFILQNLAHSKIDLVKGREIWRLTSASKSDFPRLKFSDMKSVKAVFSLAKTIKRLCPGEEKNEELYDIFTELYLFFASEDEKTDEQIKQAEILSALKILKILGYIGDSKISLFAEKPLSYSLIDETKVFGNDMIFEINKALRASHL